MRTSSKQRYLCFSDPNGEFYVQVASLDQRIQDCINVSNLKHITAFLANLIFRSLNISLRFSKTEIFAVFRKNTVKTWTSTDTMNSGPTRSMSECWSLPGTVGRFWAGIIRMSDAEGRIHSPDAGEEF